MSKKLNWYTNPRKYHFIYKTTCSVNGKYYYGMHSTDNLEDGYVGSGTYLWHSIKKHGRENFSIEILEFCSDRESLKSRESELITEEMLKDPLCMNLKLGGEGGWSYVQITKCNINSEGYRRHVESGDAKRSLCYARSFLTSEIISKRAKRFWEIHYTRLREIAIENGIKSMSSNESNEKRKQTFKEIKHQSGEKNSQFGKVWIYNDELKLCKKASKDSIQTFIDDGWKTGRKMKF